MTNADVYGIIGNPVSHSLSPIMHNEAFRHLGLNKVYLAFHVTDIEAAITGIRALGIRGLSITIPHKLSVIPYLDWIDDMAVGIGAINTIVNDGGILRGYNTDGDGAYRSIISHGIDLNGGSVLIIGNGGTARSIAYTIVNRVNLSCLYILGRNRDNVEIFVNSLKGSFPGQKIVSIIGQDSSLLPGATGESSIIINTSPVGMSGFGGGIPIDCSFISSNHTVFDCVYKPFKTELLVESCKRGASMIDGLELLVNQGAIQFELWTSKAAPIDIMYKTVYGIVGSS